MTVLTSRLDVSTESYVTNRTAQLPALLVDKPP
jgi:hypothetical protein